MHGIQCGHLDFGVLNSKIPITRFQCTVFRHLRHTFFTDHIAVRRQIAWFNVQTNKHLSPSL